MSSGRRAVALRPGQLLAVGGMLFSMFFGAGNLILPPLLGLQAGDQAIPAMTGFLIAGRRGARHRGGGRVRRRAELAGAWPAVRLGVHRSCT
ncbi:MAG: branched-chain amino acid transport system II carrier protein [Eggerthella lenta]